MIVHKNRLDTDFRGSPPEPYVIWVIKNTEVFGKKVPDERIIVSWKGKIKNVLISVEGITEGRI